MDFGHNFFISDGVLLGIKDFGVVGCFDVEDFPCAAGLK